jgi:hypothetical protein
LNILLARSRACGIAGCLKACFGAIGAAHINGPADNADHRDNGGSRHRENVSRDIPAKSRKETSLIRRRLCPCAAVVHG